MHRAAVIITFFVSGACLLWLYPDTRLPPGIEAKGGTDSLVPWNSLGASMVSLLTGVAGIALKLVEIRHKLAELKAKER